MEIIPVRILAMEPALDGSGQGGRGMPAPRAASKLSPPTPPAAETQVESKPVAPVVPNVIATEELEQVSDSEVAVIPALATASDDRVVTTNVDTAQLFAGDNSPGTPGGGAMGTGFGSGGPGSGRGSGAGLGSSAIGGLQTQARYRDTPRPEYPESARRLSHEGRVLLRVLVDDQGHSRRVEIKDSSGSEALDRAAADAVKRWRFHPARSAGKPVESWVNIPVDFRLTDLKN